MAEDLTPRILDVFSRVGNLYLNSGRAREFSLKKIPSYGIDLTISLEDHYLIGHSIEIIGYPLNSTKLSMLTKLYLMRPTKLINEDYFIDFNAFCNNESRTDMRDSERHLFRIPYDSKTLFDIIYKDKHLNKLKNI